MTRLREEHGFTLAEMLVGMVLMMFVMFATLFVLDQFTSLSKRTDRRVEVQDAARNASRQIARSLRNLAASPDAPGVVERSGPYDLVFRTVDKPNASAGENARNLRRVRYCLNSGDPDSGRVIEQTQRWTWATAPPIPADPDCPGDGWDADPRQVTDRVTNRAGGLNRPLWTYGQTGGQIASVKLNLFMNSEPETRGREVGLQTGVFLRNQNRAPTAAFSATSVGVRHALLNGSASSDPEGQPLDFHWYADGAEIGRGLVFDYYAPNAGSHTITLEVFDPSGLLGRSDPQTVVLQ